SCVVVFFFFFFFFQAEDGIRDLIVTGVQTCALPISRLRSWGGGEDRFRGAGELGRGGEFRPGELNRGEFRGGEVPSRAQLQNFRSEERRVGKECRSRWSPYQ